jgi:thermitase
MKNLNLFSLKKCLLLLSSLVLFGQIVKAGQAQEADPINLEQSWFLQKISAPLFWQRSTGSNNVKVLVCDTGIESNHPGLKDNISLPGYNFVDNSTNTEPTGNFHGTRVAGVIGSQGINKGSVGLNLHVQIVPGKITNEPSGAASSSAAAKCIRWGADQGIRIVNVSYGSFFLEPELIEAAQYLHDHGGVLIMAAGNKWGPRDDLIDQPNIIAVGMTNKDDWKTMFDPSGKFIDIVAPGTSIYTTDGGGKYMIDKGTSMSSAVVAGAAALMLSLKPEVTADQLNHWILNSTIDKGDPGRDDAFGMGRLDLQKALELFDNKQI